MDFVLVVLKSCLKLKVSLASQKFSSLHFSQPKGLKKVKNE